MAYARSDRLPLERASKLGHMRVIQEPSVQRLLDAFEQVEEGEGESCGEVTGRLDLAQAGELENVVAIDGSSVAVPNTLRSFRQVAFVTFGAVCLSRTEMNAMKAHPIVDPRDLARRLQGRTYCAATVLPLSGVVVPGQTVSSTIRRTVDDTLRATGLYQTLRFLVSREWQADYEMVEHMVCIACGEEFRLPRHALAFRCAVCGAPHTLADYLRLVHSPPDDWATAEAALGLRDILETLLLMRFLQVYRDRPVILRRTLFVKDGPLLLRAQLERLVPAIRAFFRFLRESGRAIHVVGIEKTGDLVDHVPLIEKAIPEPGDYFLPSVRYLHERIHGVPYCAATYRNRVQYGAKAVVRLGPQHVIAVNVPTGEFLTEPRADDLYGFGPSMAALADMLSYAHENALIPVVLANSSLSISLTPSTDILEGFTKRLLGE
jgi:hypothetical protein